MRRTLGAVVVIGVGLTLALLSRCDEESAGILPERPSSAADGGDPAMRVEPEREPELRGSSGGEPPAGRSREAEPVAPAAPAFTPLRFRVRVLESNEAPVPDADVLLLSHHVYMRGFFDDKLEAPLAPHHRATTDANGWAEVTLGASAHGGLHVYAWRGARSACTPSIWKPKNGQEVTLTLGPALRIGGVVVDDEGRPCADAAVTLVVELRYETMSSSIGPYGFWLPPLESAGGAFVFPPVPALGHIGAALVHAHREGVASRITVVEPEDEHTDNLRIVVARPFSVRGRCVSEAGDPIPGARVRREHVAGQSLESAATHSGEGGAFELSCVPGEESVLSILGPRHRPVQVQVGEQRELGDIVLPGSASIAGRVVGREGRPIAGASVTLSKTLPGPTRHARTDAQGRFELADIGEGPQRLYVAESTRNHWAPRIAEVHDVRPGNEDLEVVLRGARMVEVYVRFAEGSDAPKDPPYLFVTVLSLVDGTEVEERQVWDRGRYRFRVQLKSTGPHVVRAAMGDYAAEPQRVEVLGDREVRADVVLKRDG